MAAKVEQGALQGVGLAVVNTTGELWIQRDLQDKPRTGRRRGDLSIIFETQKPGESHKNNVHGALSELVNDTTMSQVADSLFTLDCYQSTPRLVFGNNGSAISYVTAVTVLDNPHFAPAPYDAEETEPVGWMMPTVLLMQHNVRPLARHAVGYLYDNDIIERTLVVFRDVQYPRELVIPSGHSISEFHQQREQVQDMVQGIPYPVSV